MVDFRQMDADLEFRRGLERFVRGHLDGCMSSALSSSSSSCGGGIDEDDRPAAAPGDDLLARRRRRPDLEGDDIAESSRRRSRIIGRWVARQAEEMITTMERRNRESELMALARLHTVSMLDSSFLRESRRLPSSPVERPVASRAPSILQMWRELEDVSTGRDRRVAAPVGDDRRRTRRQEPLGHSEDPSESDYNGYNASSREQSPDIGDGEMERERESERVRQIISRWMTDSHVADTGSRVSARNDGSRSEWLGEVERERVRLVRGWMQMKSQQRDARATRREERERERPASHREERERERDRSASQREESEMDRSAGDHEEGLEEHTRRDVPRIRGRQARQDLITRMAQERQRELQSLSEHRAVSEFSQSNRIQALLRGRFLRNGMSTEDERPSAVATRELGQLRQRHHVSGLRSVSVGLNQAVTRSSVLSDQNVVMLGNNQPQQGTEMGVFEDSQEITQTESDNVDIQEAGGNDNIENEPRPRLEGSAPTEAQNWQQEADNERREGQPPSEGGFGRWHQETGEISGRNWQENIEVEVHGEMPEDEGEDGQLLEEHEEWHDDESQGTIENWQDDYRDPPPDQPSIPRSTNQFIPRDDDNVYSMELRELLSRRSVSNLLHSGFRESLDQLIRSYIQRQDHGPLNWNLEATLPAPNLPEENDGWQRDNGNRDFQDSVDRPRGIPSPPLPPRQPLWHSLHHNNWRQNMQRSVIEWDAINDLRADMARLQHGMSHMQRMLVTCMDMQLELQRSVRQEVSAALNRFGGGPGLVMDLSDAGSNWSQVRKGTCCVCCDAQIDSLLYRCGHICTCSKCANELVRGGGKCPLCRAPIAEVVRAYSVV